MAKLLVKTMSDINNHEANMKGKMTAIIAGTLLAITGASLPAFATVSNTNAQHLTGGQQTQKTLQLAKGSHKIVQMCAKFRWKYLERDNKAVVYGTTTPEMCGRKYREGHAPEEQRQAKRSLEEACDAAQRKIPKLKRGERWVERTCAFWKKG